MRTTKSLDHAEAQRVIDAIRTEAGRRGKSVAIVVVDPHGEPIASLRMDGTKLPALNIAFNKAYTSARLREETSELGRRARDPVTGFDIAYFGDPRIVGWGGGVPVIINGELVGAIGVSGLTELEDTEVANAGIGALAG